MNICVRPSSKTRMDIISVTTVESIIAKQMFISKVRKLRISCLLVTI